MHALRAKKITQLSKILRSIALAIAAIAPLFTALFWINDAEQVFPWIRYDFPEGIRHLQSIGPLSPGYKLLGFLVNLIPACFIMAIMCYLARLFRLFGEMKFFTSESVRCIRRVGLVLFFAQITHPFYVGLLSLVLTISHPPGHRLIATELTFHELAMIAVASGIILVSWILDEGRKLQEEQESTI